MNVPFGRILRLGDRGDDVVAIKRAVARSGGTNDPKGLRPLFGKSFQNALKMWQRSNELRPDGVYGPRTHAALEPWFDQYGYWLYTGHKPPPPDSLQLPATFTPTHQTGGLPGYPAIDCFAAAGTLVLAPADGKVRRFSGHDPAQGDVGGRVYGWSMYLGASHADYYLTHFATRIVRLNDEIRRGDPVGTVCDAAVAGLPTSSSHIHEGLHDL